MLNFGRLMSWFEWSVILRCSYIHEPAQILYHDIRAQTDDDILALMYLDERVESHTNLGIYRLPIEVHGWYNIHRMRFYYECSGSIVVTTLNCGPGGPWFRSRVGANILWVLIDCTGLSRAFIPSVWYIGTRWAEHKGCIWCMQIHWCKFIDGCSLKLRSAIVSVASSGICHINKVNTIACLYPSISIEMASP